MAKNASKKIKGKKNTKKAFIASQLSCSAPLHITAWSAANFQRQ
jgi:hypothetical protein